MSLPKPKEIPALQRLMEYQAAITAIASHVGATCGGIDTSPDDIHGTVGAILSRIDDLIFNARFPLKEQGDK